ncbi:MAG: replicative DNA helicase [Candidatus Zambryskibacteria bacterium RIFCSPLOWO2_01_FULL_39_39]|uniref:Replicative DNA helicase n=1 Tax=Candidatus Zambryskibacteria bacterium RIFCSPLOWO2_01_FULL_39_39 TaxID=1802758 RepID=A0A1G2TVW1_9BACT|nr:MAG: replicative DNA helicase [Candidatus Zambryskibacteria bacterium RIFCSPHIGHO2_01_FULL_39_63]OHA94225.1 MAG: replicative DNA helicase [Candidatus Zambryskibacteria bacterium RIFCSPHIGHO2_02_FULL_39_19]OHA98508.1 MAG: replicative DNA helicase [Candidatus Zambryskibacteria bacterium RIFCSPHIGHO2_12_FULL_39_21]OHB01427.1 MAG: replicative DNA helicase [Candidatus Zambryskibacteria bacterium RIFCSPLOWO2_01_FULL_39_39]
MEQKKTHLRIPPNNTEAERALLGSIMLRPEVMFEITDLTHSSSFYSERHRLIFETMLELFSKRNPTDLLTVSARLKEKNLLEETGGNTYLGEIINSVPSAANASYYAQIIQKKHIARNLIGAADFISSLGYDEVAELEELLDQAQKKIYDVTNVSSIHKFVELKEELSEAWERLDRLHNSGDGLRGVPTGFKELDEKLSGLQKSDLIILAARPSVGKTALALDIARQAAVYHNVPVGIFSLEMSSQQLVDRMLASQSNVDAWKLRTGKLNREDDFAAIRQSLDVLSKAPIFIDDQPGNNILKMRSVARRLKNEKGLGLIVVDYLQLMITTKNYDSMVNQVTEISRSLKNLARELEVPVLALSQLSRAIEQRGGKPKLSDLRDSGSIEQDADVVMFIHREDKAKNTEASEKTNIAEILIEKHRNGATGKVELFFDEKKATFLPLEKAQFSGAESEFREF